MNGRKFIITLVLFALMIVIPLSKITHVKSQSSFLAKDIIFDDFKATKLVDSHVFSSQNVVGQSNPVHALLPAEKWGDPVETGSGFVIYKLSSRLGYKLNEINLVLNAKITHLSKKEYFDNNLKIYTSLNNVKYDLFETVSAGENQIKEYEFNFGGLSSFDFYVKLEMNNVSGQLPLALVGVKIFSVKFEIIQQPTNEIRETEKSMSSEYYGNVSNYKGSVFSNENKVGFCGSGWYEKPISVDSGVKISLSNVKLKDHSIYDCWLSVALMAEKKAGNFINRSTKGLYFMFFLKNGELKCNLIFSKGDGNETSICNGYTVGLQGDDITITVRRKQHSKSRSMIVFVNDKELMSSHASKIMNYMISDNELNSYLTFSSLGTNNQISQEDLHSAVIESLSYVDINGPKISVKNHKEEYSVGLITLPTVEISDSGEIKVSRIRLFSPDGKIIPFVSNKFSTKVKGRYLLLIEAEDKNNNRTVEQVYINVV